MIECTKPFTLLTPHICETKSLDIDRQLGNLYREDSMHSLYDHRYDQVFSPGPGHNNYHDNAFSQFDANGTLMVPQNSGNSHRLPEGSGTISKVWGVEDKPIVHGDVKFFRVIEEHTDHVITI